MNGPTYEQKTNNMFYICVDISTKRTIKIRKKKIEETTLRGDILCLQNITVKARNE